MNREEIIVELTRRITELYDNNWYTGRPKMDAIVAREILNWLDSIGYDSESKYEEV